MPMNINEENNLYTSPSGSTYSYTEKTKKYMVDWRKANLDRLSLYLPFAVKEIVKEYATNEKESVNSYIQRLIYEDMVRKFNDKKYPPEELKKMVDIYKNKCNEFFAEYPELKELHKPCEEIQNLIKYLEE